VDYLVGHTTFFAMELRVTPAVLVPRPSTETVVEHVLQHSRRTPGFRTPRIADVGTGSGCIAVALARHLPEARVVATDLHADALELAKLNAQEQGVANRVEFRMGDLLAPLQGERFHYLVSNPPYISDAEWLEVDRNVKDHEPVHALRGGRDGLDLIRPLIAQASRHLLTPGQLVLEVAAAHKETVLALALDAGLRDAHVLVDHERLPRVLVANW
jgi:release factor glutamine methyltransferase